VNRLSLALTSEHETTQVLDSCYSRGRSKSEPAPPESIWSTPSRYPVHQDVGPTCSPSWAKRKIRRRERSSIRACCCSPRLSPDQFSLMQQIRTPATRKAGRRPPGRSVEKDAPVHGDTEQTLGEIKARQSKASSPICVASRRCLCRGGRATDHPAALDGNTLSGQEFLIQHVTPNSISTSPATRSCSTTASASARGHYLGDMPYREAA